MGVIDRARTERARWRKTRLLGAVLPTAVGLTLIVSCGTSPTAPGGPVTFAFDFSQGVQGWQAGFAEYVIGSTDADRFRADYLALPAPLDTTRSALFLSSSNTQSSGGPFMFEKRLVSGLGPSHTYRVSIVLELATEWASGCYPTGCPGEGVYVKAGASVTEPTTYADGNIQRITLNKGDGPTGGTQAVVLGDISNGGHYSPIPEYDTTMWTFKTLQGGTVSLTTDSTGTAWLIFGTDSTFKGPTWLYFTKFSATFTPG